MGGLSRRTEVPFEERGEAEKLRGLKKLSKK